MSTQNNKILVSDVMLLSNKFPVVKKNTLFKEALEAMNMHSIGIACIVDEQNVLLGILTDGDIRRMLLRVQKPFAAFFADDALDHANTKPIKLEKNTTLTEAVSLMDSRRIWDLPVLDDSRHLLGLLHLHPAVNALLKNQLHMQ
jgi:arabinose-5-phosphate isomerase